MYICRLLGWGAITTELIRSTIEVRTCGRPDAGCPGNETEAQEAGVDTAAPTTVAKARQSIFTREVGHSRLVADCVHTATCQEVTWLVGCGEEEKKIDWYMGSLTSSYRINLRIVVNCIVYRFETTATWFLSVSGNATSQEFSCSRRVQN